MSRDNAMRYGLSDSLMKVMVTYLKSELSNNKLRSGWKNNGTKSRSKVLEPNNANTENRHIDLLMVVLIISFPDISNPL